MGFFSFCNFEGILEAESAMLRKEQAAEQPCQSLPYPPAAGAIGVTAPTWDIRTLQEALSSTWMSPITYH